MRGNILPLTSLNFLPEVIFMARVALISCTSYDDADAAVNGKAKPRPNPDENNMFCWYFTFQRNACYIKREQI